MLDQARVWGVLENSLRECAGVLRRRLRAATVFGVLGMCAVFVLLGADAFVSHDATVLAVVLVLVAAFWALKSHPLKLARRGIQRRVASFRNPVERSVDRGVQRFGRYYPIHEAPVERPTAVDGFAVRHEPAHPRGIDQR